MKAFYITEPNLFFKNGECIDPRIGLLNFLPHGLSDRNKRIKVGIIGDAKAHYFSRQFFHTLQYPIRGLIYPDSHVRSIDFPGLIEGGELGFWIDYDESIIQPVPDEKMDQVFSQSTRWLRVKGFVDLIDNCLEEITGTQDPPLILIPITETILKKCRDQAKEKRIRLWNRNYKALKGYIKRPEEERPPIFDFHHYVKVLGFKHHIPTQIIKPSTLQFGGGQEHDPSTIAWNFAVAQFYKFSTRPWKLADLAPDTIHVGISFYLDIDAGETIVKRASVAQVYMRDTDAQIVRGLKIPVQNLKESKKTNLTKDEATEILTKAINVYKQSHQDHTPTRIVVHKTSPYEEDERIGFKASTSDDVIQDYLHIKIRGGFRVITPTKYPICRGSVFESLTQGKVTLDICTSGFVPALATYPGSQVPQPLRVICDKCDSPSLTIATDILNLTKLDWNSTDFCKRLPVTISVAEKVGKILGEINGRPIEPPSPYSYYM